MKKLISNAKYEFRINYYADDNGHIWSEVKRDYLTEYDDKDGYKKVYLMTKDRPTGKGHRFSVHRLILETFNPNPKQGELQVDHISGNRKDNRLINLRWTTPSENLSNPNTLQNRRVYHQDGSLNASAKFNQDLINSLIEDVNSGKYYRKEILNKYQICDETLRKILLRKSYINETANLKITPSFKKVISKGVTGEKNANAKLNEKQVLEIIDLLLKKEMKIVDIAEKYNVSISTINRIKSKENWCSLSQNIDFN